MRTHISMTVLLIVTIALFSACGIMRRDMFNPGNDSNKGSGEKITINTYDGLVTSEATPSSDTFTVVLNEAPNADVTFPITSVNTGEVTVSPSSVTFTTGNWNIPQTVTVYGVDDLVADNTQPVSITIGAAVSSDPNWNGFNPPDVTVYNIDNDSSQTPGVTVSSSGALLLSETGASGSFAVVLDAPPVYDVTIPISVSDGSEATVTSPFSGVSGNLVFMNIDWNIPQVVLVRGVDDPDVDGNYAGTITVGTTSSSDPVYNGTFNPPDVPFTNVDDDAAGVTVNAAAGMAVSESGTTGSFTVVLNSRPSGSNTVTVPVSVSDATEGTITAPFSGSTGSLTFGSSDWDVPQAVTVAGVDDFTVDGNTGFTIVLGTVSSGDSHYTTPPVNPSDVNFTNIDDDAAGVTVNAGDPSKPMVVSESGTNSSFTLVLNSQPFSDVTIPVSVSDATEGTITAPFFGVSGSVVFTSADWNVPKTLSVAGVRDALSDGNQPFNVILGTTISSDFAYDGTIDPPDVAFLCVDDCRPGVTVSAGSPMVVSESGTAASFTVVLNSKTTNNVTIPVSVSDATEGTVTAPFTGTSGSIVFTDTDWDVPRTITVSGLGDSLNDGDQAFNVVLGPTSSTDPIYNGTFGPTNVPFVCIDEDGIAAVIVVSGSPMMVSESGTSSSFRVVLASQPSSNVTIPLSVSDTTEGVISAPFAGTSGTITFTPGNWSTLQTVTVTGVKDALADGNQAFLADFGPTSSADANYNGLAVGDVGYVCIDDYSAGVTVNSGDPATPMMVSEGGTESSFQVVLNSRPGSDVSIDISVSDPSEGRVTAPFTGTFGTITFTTGNWNIPKTLTVAGMNDFEADGNLPFTAALSNTVSADPLYDNLPTPDVAFVNVDDDTPGVTVMAGSYYMVSESGTYCAFEVVLNSRPGSDVSIPVWIDNPAEGGLITPASGLLVFTPANWNMPQTVAAGGLDDFVADGNQPFKVILGITSSPGDPVYDGTFDPVDVSFLNVDDDSAGITVNIGDGLITKEHPTAPLSDTFRVVLNSAPAADVTIGPIASLDAGEVTVSPPNLTFTPGNWNIAQTVTVTGVDDPWGDGVQTVTVDLGLASSADPNYNGRDPGDVTVYNIDNEAPPKVIVLQPPTGYRTSENGALAEIMVVLSTMPASPVTLPSIVSSDPTEGSVITTSLTFTPANWDNPQTVWVAGVADGGRGDGNTVYSVNLGTCSSAAPYWNGLNAGTVNLVNLDYITIPDYAWSITPGSFTSISATGTILNFKDNNLGDANLEPRDEGYDYIPLGFSFYYIGRPYNMITVYTNGFCSFSPYVNTVKIENNKDLFSNNAEAAEFVNILAPWWEDLSTEIAGSDVYYTTSGIAPNRVTTIEWWNAKQVSGSLLKTFSFQLKLYEGSNMFEFVYGPRSDGGGNDASASVGIKDDVGGNDHFMDGINGCVNGGGGGPKDNRKYTEYPAIGQVIRFTP